MRLPTSMAILCLLTMLAGCSDATVSNTSESANQRVVNPVLVVMGGFNSCVTNAAGARTPIGSGRWWKADRLSTRYAQGSARWVRSCFDMSGNIYYVTAKLPTVVQHASAASPISFFEAIKAETNAGQNPVYLIGHSHGGWLAMYASYWMPSWVTVRKVVTVDPISASTCTWQNYAAAAAVLSPAFIAGCQEAPVEFTEPLRAKILARLPYGGWLHYYQRNFLPLRSSAFVGGSQPSQTYDVSSFLSVTHGGAHASTCAHIGIDELSVVWYTFEASMGADLSDLRT